MVNIIYSRQGAGKTACLFEKIKETKTDRKVFLVVPEQSTYENERMVMDKLEVNGTMHIQVVSLQRLASMIAANTPLKDKTILTQEGKGLIIKRVVDELSPSLSIFKGVSDKYGFLDNVMEFIDELKKNTIQSEKLLKLCESEETTVLKDKLTDIHQIYSRYDHILSGDYIDQQDFLVACAEYVKTTSAIAGGYFFFDGFHTFDRSAFCLIQALMETAEQCTFTLTYDTEDFFSATSDTLIKLKHCAQNAHQSVEVTKLNGKKASPDDMIFLEQNLMHYEDVRYAKDSASVELFQADNIYSEVENTAMAINRFVRQKKIRFSDIAVVVPEIALYAPIIEEIFENYQIAFFMDKRKEIIFSSPIKAFLFLIAMMDKNYTTSEIIAYAKTGFSDIADEQCQLIENYALEFGIKGSMWEKEFTRNNFEGSYDLTDINTIREKLIRPVSDMREAMKNYTDTSDFCVKLFTYLETCSFNGKIAELTKKFADNGDHEMSNTYAQIYNKIISVLEQAYDFFKDVKITPEQVHQMLTYAFISSNVGIIPATLDRVNVGDILRSRVGSVKALFMLGANEGMLPSASSDKGLLSEEEKNFMQARGIDLINTAPYRRQKELFLIYTLLSKPSEKCILSRFIKDREGEDYDPSFLFERMRDIFPNVEVKKDHTDGEIDLLIETMIDSSGAFHKLTGNLSDRFYNKDHDASFDGIFNDIYLYYCGQKEYSPLMDALKEGLQFDNSEEISNSELYQQAVKLPLTASISMLEKYAACPFSFFAQYLIHPQERREQSVKNTDIGSVLHKIVEIYSGMILDKKIDAKTISETALSQTVQAITENVLGEYSSGLFAQIAQSRYLKVKLLRAAENAVSEITRQLTLSDFLLTETEAKFRFNEKYQPICVDIEGSGKVYVQGIIDRIDTYELQDKKYVKIIDYKTGNRDFDITKAYYGLSLQLPVYMKACIDNMESMDAAGVFYFRIKSAMTKITKETDEDKIKELIRKNFQLKGITVRNLEIIRAMDHNAEGDSFIGNVSVKKDGTLKENNSLIDAETFYALLHHTQHNIKDTAQQIISGDITITPYRFDSKETPCTYCKYIEFCKFSEEFGANKYRNFRKQKAQELFGRMKKENLDNGIEQPEAQ